jgi:N-acetylglucosamine kinase-like BadF-type ATPase
MDAHRAEFTCCTPGNACYFAAEGVRYANCMRCVLGFDGGGTKTDCVLMDETGAVLARTRSGPSNPILVGIHGGAGALIDGAQQALALSNLTVTDVRFVNGAIAGAGAARDLPQLITNLKKKFTNARVLVDSDARMAIAATGENPSVVVIAGTGSVVYGRNGEEIAREGGLGAILGDPGSAYDIGRRAVIAECHRMLDKEDSELRNKILRDFAADWEALQERLRANPIEVLPRVFPLVAQAANENDKLLQDLLCSAAEELAGLVQRVVKRLHLDEGKFLLAKTGGVFGRSKYFDETFDRRVQAIAPRVRIGGLPMPVAEFAARSALANLHNPVRLLGGE